jgi:hypothetical protein
VTSKAQNTNFNKSSKTNLKPKQIFFQRFQRQKNVSEGSCEIDFLDLLEKEEADFAEQVRRQKSFLQGVFKDKEELAQVGKQ